MKQLMTRIDDELHRQFKAVTAINGDNMSRLIEGWIRQYVESRKDPVAMLTQKEFPMYSPMIAPEAAQELAKLLAEAAA